MNGIDQYLVHADLAGFLGEDINIVKNITQALSETNKEVGLEVNTKKIKYIFTFVHQAIR